MTKRYSKCDYVKDFVSYALEKWGSSFVKTIKPSLERTAEGIYKIDQYQIELDEEPASLTLYYYLLQEERHNGSM